MQIDDFLKLVRKRRSIRRFKSDPIPDGYVKKIIEAARWSMSGANGQPWEFIVVKDRETIDKIADLYTEYGKRTWYIEETRISELRHPAHHAYSNTSPIKSWDAPVLIIVCGDPRTYQATMLAANFLVGEGGPHSTYLKNMSNATHNLHLAAAALGLGSQWVSVSRPWECPLKAILNVPDELDIHTIVPIGYPAYKPAAPYRRNLDEIVHYEKYDSSKYRSGEDIFKFLLNLRQRTREAYPD